MVLPSAAFSKKSRFQRNWYKVFFLNFHRRNSRNFHSIRREKDENYIQKFIHKSNYFNYFTSFWVVVVFILLFCLVSRKTLHFKNVSTWTNRSVIPTLVECQELQIILNLLEVATQFSWKKKLGSNFSSETQSKTCYFYKSVHLKNQWFFSLR